MPVSALVAKLITDIQVGIQAAFLQQMESTSREIEARVVNEKNVEALEREAGAIGEIEISFNVDLR